MQPPVLGGYDCIWVSDSIIQFENFILWKGQER